VADDSEKRNTREKDPARAARHIPNRKPRLHDSSVSPIGVSLVPFYSSLPVQLFSGYTMDRIFGKKKAPGPPPPSLDEASAGLDGRLGNMDGT
jgi:hypothetical protein